MNKIVSRILFACLALAPAACSKKVNELDPVIKAPTRTEEQLLDEAVTAYDRGLYSLSRDMWTELRDGYPGNLWAPIAELKIADCDFYTDDYAAALVAYEEFARIRPAHEAMPYVRFQIANSYFKQYQGEKNDQNPLQSATKMYQQLIAEYPDSEYVPLARRKIQEAREEMARHELFIAKYYIKQGALESAANRLRELHLKYSDTDASRTAEKTLFEKYPDKQLELDRLTALRESIPAKNPESNLPHAPQLVSSRRAENQPSLLASAPLTTMPHAESKTARASLDEKSHKKEAKAAPVKSLFVSSFQCATEGDARVFTAYLRQPASTTNTKQADSTTATAEIKFTETASGAAKNRDCSVGEFSATLSENAAQKTVLLKLNFPAGSRYNLLTMDRPDRIIAVIRP